MARKTESAPEKMYKVVKLTREQVAPPKEK